MRAPTRIVALVALTALGCSGKTKGAEDARKHQDSAAHDPTLPPPTGTGDVQLRVEWQNVPLESRASAGRTACGTPRAASVAPTTTWAIPDVFVMIDAPPTVKKAKNVGSAASDAGSDTPRDAGSAANARASTAREARVVLDRCALTPRVAIATKTLVLASGADSPAKLALSKTPDPFGAAAAKTDPARIVYLPVAGHSVEVAVDPKVAYHVEIATDDGKGRDAEDAWIVVADSPYVAITEPNGQVLLRDLPVGTYTATAWLPARAGQPARIAHAPVTITDGGIAEITLDISK